MIKKRLEPILIKFYRSTELEIELLDTLSFKTFEEKFTAVNYRRTLNDCFSRQKTNLVSKLLSITGHQTSIVSYFSLAFWVRNQRQKFLI